MSLLSSARLHQLIDEGVITAKHENVNSASIDVCIGDTVLKESKIDFNKVVDLDKKESLDFTEFKIPKSGLGVLPGDFFLAHTEEFFNLPDNISCEFKLRSSIARSGLQHMLAGWCDAGWNGAQLTMEFRNVTRNHNLVLKPGMRVGQMVFFEHEPVGKEDSYATKGNYNNQVGATKAFSGEGHK